jgi:hypothetical protein
MSRGSSSLFTNSTFPATQSYLQRKRAEFEGTVVAAVREEDEGQ